METVLAAVTRGLSASASVDVIGPHGYHEAGVRRIWKGPFSILGFYLTGLLAIARMRPGQYDCVLAGSVLMAPLARLAARRVRGPFMVLAHGLDVTYANRVYQALFLPAARRAHTVVANSRFTAEQLELRGFDAARIQLIFPGVDLPEKAGDRQGFRLRYGLGKQPVLLGVGRIIPRKGFLEFVRDVFPLVLREIPDARFVLVGEEPPGASGALVEAIGKLVAELGLENQVILTGSKIGDDLADAYAAADVHVFPVRDLPGDPEGFGVVALEAAAHGSPTVAYATGGVADAVRHGLTGRLVQPGDATRFASEIVDLLGCPPVASQVRQHAESSGWGHYCQRILDAMKQAQSGR